MNKPKKKKTEEEGKREKGIQCSEIEPKEIERRKAQVFLRCGGAQNFPPTGGGKKNGVGGRAEDAEKNPRVYSLQTIGKMGVSQFRHGTLCLREGGDFPDQRRIRNT